MPKEWMLVIQHCHHRPTKSGESQSTMEKGMAYHSTRHLKQVAFPKQSGCRGNPMIFFTFKKACWVLDPCLTGALTAALLSTPLTYDAVVVKDSSLANNCTKARAATSA
ncbi:hypothetical protein EYF80_041326 [Liparis tanakae]|uniref:Uncharacterized protein n=1 Tax=Liparis tanakae TaxID=230148 RepID=A0A4Z2G5Z1_9TELE|nr:hypothetical protein EYF80_041326 [Liparis tanakae]